MLIIAALFMTGVLMGEWIVLSTEWVLVLALLSSIVALAAVWLGQRCDGAVSVQVGFLNDRLGMAFGVAEPLNIVVIHSLVGCTKHPSPMQPKPFNKKNAAANTERVSPVLVFSVTEPAVEPGRMS